MKKSVVLGLVVVGVLSCAPTTVSEKEKKCARELVVQLYTTATVLPVMAEVQRDLMKMLVAKGMSICEAWETIKDWNIPHEMRKGKEKQKKEG